MINPLNRNPVYWEVVFSFFFLIFDFIWKLLVLLPGYHKVRTQATISTMGKLVLLAFMDFTLTLCLSSCFCFFLFLFVAGAKEMREMFWLFLSVKGH